MLWPGDVLQNVLVCKLKHPCQSLFESLECMLDADHDDSNLNMMCAQAETG